MASGGDTPIPVAAAEPDDAASIPAATPAAPVVEPVVRSVDAIREERRQLRTLRSAWLADIPVPDVHGKLFELEMYLKAIDRFLNLRNQAIDDQEELLTRDFAPELRILTRAVGRVATLAQNLLPGAHSSAMHFTHYVGEHFLGDYARAQILDAKLKQRTPEESLYILKDAFSNQREVLAALTQLPRVPFAVFRNVGQIIMREIALNRFFNPTEVPDFSPESDRIENRAITYVIRNEFDPALRRELSIAFLFYFRLLHYLDYIVAETADLEGLHDSVLIFSLLNSECMVLTEFLESDMVDVIRKQPPEYKKITEELMRDTADSLAYQVEMEMKKIYTIELAGMTRMTDINKLRTAVIRSKGVLVDILRQGVVQLATLFHPELQGAQVFEAFTSKLELSIKLRKDVWVFHKVCAHLEMTLNGALESRNLSTVPSDFNKLTNFIYYFHNVSFQSVRYADREHFEKFFAAIGAVDEEDLVNEDTVHELTQTIHSFRMFLAATLTNIEQRAELYQRPMRIEEGQTILAQFLN